MRVWTLLLSVWVLATFAKTEICRFGDVDAGCALSCNCTQGCDQTTGTCLQGGTCPDGPPTGFPWHGPGCRIGNVAYNSEATQRGTFCMGGTDLRAGLAVDGGVANDENSCAHTNGPWGGPPTWWYVDLGDVYKIYSVTLFNRKYARQHQDEAARMGNFRIGMSNDTSFTDGSGEHCLVYPGFVPNRGRDTLNCSVNNVGRYFFLHKYPESREPPLISICEVVLDGYRVIDCSRCPSACNDLTGCDRCPPGHRYPDCKECNSGKWGDNCDFDCTVHCKDSDSLCDVRDGTCSQGCKDGHVNEVWYYGPHCNMSSDSNEVSIGMSLSYITANQVELVWSSNIPPDLAMNFMYQSWYETRNDTISNKRENLSIETGPDLHQTRTFSDLTPATNYTFYVRILRVSSNGSDYPLESSTTSLNVFTATAQVKGVPCTHTKYPPQIPLIAGVAAGGVLSMVLAISIVVLLLKRR